ncbi:MAG: sulfatase-like hydrolase/transferase, partial [Coriobacteriales bacterium]
YLSQCMCFNPFTSMSVRAQLYNLLLSELFTLLLYQATGRLGRAVSYSALVALCWALANYYVITFRGTPVSLVDLFSFGIAGEVAGDYDYSLGARQGIVTAALLAIVFFARLLRLRTSSRGRSRVLSSLVLVCVFVAGLVVPAATVVRDALGMIDDEVNPVRMAGADGFSVEFFANAVHGRVHERNGCSADEARQVLDAYPADGAGADQVQTRPNIIVVMVESYSDPGVLCDFTTNRDYLPFTHALMDGADDVQSGYLNVSILGGKTANTEFEYLTGDSMFSMPRYSVPYQSYVRQPTYSLASYLEGYGYETVAMHPYVASGWNRDKVYPLLGFSQERFLPDFDTENQQDTLRGFMTDSAAYRQIVEEYENKPEGTPLFCFEVTIQNHSSYSANPNQGDFVPDITVEGTDDSETVGYLSLMERSDEALSELIGYFSQQSEPTVIVFFGDHQPANAVVDPLLAMSGKSSATLEGEDEFLRYRVPCVIWANYDIPEKTGVQTSANYLAVDTLKAAGLPVCGYFAYLDELQDSYPVIAAGQVRASDGSLVDDPRQDARLEEYRDLARHEVFGEH